MIGQENFIEGEPVPHDPFRDQWARQLRRLPLSSPIDQKARDLAVEFFNLDRTTISSAAVELNINRNTVTRRLERAHRNGWVVLGDPPIPAREATLPRVCGRRVFWTVDYWDNLPVWHGNTSSPVF